MDVRYTDAPGDIMIEQTSGRRLGKPFGLLGLIGWLRGPHLFGRLLFAAVFPLKLLTQFALNAGMRSHNFTIRLCQRLCQFAFVNRPGGLSLPARMVAFNEADSLIANSAFHLFLPPGRRQNTCGEMLIRR